MGLYQKYRPKKWNQVVGNANVVASIQGFLGAGNLPHACLFTGPSGTGKTTLARLTARELGCVKEDYTELDSADFRGIDTIRAVRRKLVFAPRFGAVRVYLLDECHQLTRDAQDALLKGLEDTPSHVWIFLATTEPAKLLPTIRTRCTQFETTLLSAEEIAKDLLWRVCKAEGLEVPKPILKQIAMDSLGSARVAMVMLERISGLPPGDMADALATWQSEEADTKRLCQLLLKSGKWSEATEILGKLRAQDAENVRQGVLGYMTAVMLSPRGGAGARARFVAECFRESFFYSRFNGLVAACYDAIHLGD